MAGEITHVVFAGKLAPHVLEDTTDRDYWIGTLFPDIRHLGMVSRHRTHPEKVTRTSLSGDSSFMTGLRVHTWLDATREEYLRQQNAEEKLPLHPFIAHALKLYEDELMYSQFDNWDFLYRTLNNITDDERSYVSDDLTITRWHNILQAYFKGEPTDASRLALSEGIGLSKPSGQEINSLVHELRQSNAARTLLESVWQHIENLIA